MKKNIVKVAFVAAIALAYGINVFNAQKSETLSGIAFANLKALAIYKPSHPDCASYCQEDERFTCYIDWGNDTELITCTKQRKK